MTKIKNGDGQNGIRRARESEDEVAGRTGVPTNQSVTLGSPLLLRIKDRHSNIYFLQCVSLYQFTRRALMVVALRAQIRIHVPLRV
jgi:hypothetical protein